MDKKIISLAEENKVEELRKELQSVSNEELCQQIERKVLKGRNDTFTLVRAILLGSPPEDSGSIQRRSAVYRLCVEVLQNNEMNNKMASELVGLLMLEADTLPGPTLAELASIYVDAIKSGATQLGKALELFPKLLSAIASQENIVFAGNHMKGSDYKSHVLNSLCSCKWDTGSVIHLAAMFCDVPLTADELQFVMEKMLRMFKTMEMADIPSLECQLLLLSTKGHKRLVLEGIINYFVEQDLAQKPENEQEFSEDLLDDGNSVEELRHTEGTVILHILLAVKQDQDLGREFVKYLKSNQQGCASKSLSPFNLALALSLSRIQRFETQIFDFLKAMVLKHYKDKEKKEQSAWIEEVVDDAGSVEDFVLQTVKNSTYGWDHVVQGLVELGFILMDSFGPKAAFGRVDVTPSLQSGPTHQACQLGSKLLLSTFKAHEMVRADILEQIFNRVVTKATSPVQHFLELLGNTVYASPQMLLDSTHKIREMFDHLSYLSPGSAEGLLRAIQPLLKLSMTLKDSLILVLRKSMFSTRLDSRKIGAAGFLMFLKYFRVLGGLRSSQYSQPMLSSSQVEVDVHIVHNPSSNEALCLEILGNLRRCLSQEADVRLLVYQGLIEILDKNTELRDPILEMMMQQLKGYYEKNGDVNPPLKLEPCIMSQGEQVYLVEPLSHLLCCIQLCMVKVIEIKSQKASDNDDDDDDDDGDDDSIQKIVKNLLESLVKRMITSELEDFELDKSADFSLANSVGVRNNLFAILILGTYESLIEYTFMRHKMSETGMQQLLQLFEHYRKLADILKEKTAAGAKKTKTVTTKTPHSLLSIRMVAEILEVLIGDSDKEQTEYEQALMGNTDFLKYILNVCHQKLQQVHDKNMCDGAEGKDKKKIFEYSCTLASLFLKYYIRKQGENSDQRVREKQILSTVVECLLSVVTCTIHRRSELLPQLIVSLSDGDSSDDTNEDIFKLIQTLQRLVMDHLAADEDKQNLKDVGLLLNTIFQLAHGLPANFNKMEQILLWIEKICKDNDIDDIPLCKLLLSSMLSFTQKLKTSTVLLRDLSQDVHSILGDIDQEIEVENRTNYGLVTQRTAAPTVLLLVLGQIDRELDDTDWLIGRIRSEANGNAKSDWVENMGNGEIARYEQFILFLQCFQNLPTTNKGLGGKRLTEMQRSINKYKGDESPQLTQREGKEKSVCKKLGIMVGAFHELVQSAMPIGPCTESLLKTLTKLYCTLTSVSKYYLMLYTTKNGHLTASFEKLVKMAGTHLTQFCYAMITYIQSSESEQIQHAAPEKGKKKKDDKKKGAGNQAGKAVFKQTKTIPNLIFAIEQYERYLIQLSKKSKTNLMEHMKHSMPRDFRINVAVLAEKFDNEDSDELSSDNEEGNETTDQNETAADTRQESSGDENSEEENIEPDREDKSTEEPVAKKCKTSNQNRLKSKNKS